MRPLIILTAASLVAGRPQITADSLGFNPKSYGSKSDYLGVGQITAASLGLSPAYFGGRSDYLGEGQISDSSLSFRSNVGRNSATDLITQSNNLIETLKPALEALASLRNTETGNPLQKTQNLLDNLDLEALANLGNNGKSFSSNPLQKTQNLLDNLDLEALANLGNNGNSYSSSPLQRSQSLGNFGTEVSNIDSNVIQQTRDILNSITPTLKELASDPSSADIANKIIQENYSSCVSSLQEGIDSIESARQLVDSFEPAIVALTNKVNSFAGLSDPVEIMRETADLLRSLQPLAEKTQLSDFNLKNCEASQIEFTFPSLGRNGGPAFTTFFRQLKSTTARMENLCTNDIFNRDSIKAIGDMLDVVADLYVSLGDAETGEKIRYGKTYTERVTDQLTKVGARNFGIDIDCSAEVDLATAAATMDDLANIVEDTGLEALQEQLGIDLSFAFSFDPPAKY